MPPVPDAPPPSRCPFCRSSSVKQTGAKPTPDSYWRCESCQQIWHQDRVRATIPYGNR